ncbi:trafficking protein particle complex subunit 9 isoform X1 [Tripterygium wilfordii]|uniref:Trafficking protein particle complex subunit 9 isoform X1 n=1 Tax=Tripterygium wilfordii TaxID=458696 RepID=A0A7J7DPB1_TRIWF|nr:trafficking protein particle complex subunit 9 isoform X1 [Tripterygium wilfordii]
MRGNLILFPPPDRQTHEFHFETMMQDIAASLLIEFEKWFLKAESAGTILKMPLDSQASLSLAELCTISKRWESGRNSAGELNIDAVQTALQTSVMDVLLPDPLTFGFRLVRHDREHAEKLDVPIESSICIDKGSVLAHDMTPMEVLVRNNTTEMIKSLSIRCRDVAGENCAKGVKATVLWSDVLNGITMEVPALQESRHSFFLYFPVPDGLDAKALIWMPWAKYDGPQPNLMVSRPGLDLDSLCS